MTDIAPIRLGVNVDHVATVRQARMTRYPDPVTAALIAEQSGADSITIHVREDRRHIQERDLELMQELTQTRVNLEMATTDAMLEVAERARPADCCLVPERREELTTEGGLDVVTLYDKIVDACQRLGEQRIRVSLFVDPDPAQLDACMRTGARVVELHTGAYAIAGRAEAQARELARIHTAVQHGRSIGLTVHAGHGLHYHNVTPIAAIAGIVELNIGHAIVAQALFDGFAEAVRKMKELMVRARQP